MCSLYKRPSIDASYQVLVHLAKTSKGFQRIRLKCEKLTDNRRRTASDGKSSHCLWQGELKRHNFRIISGMCKRSIVYQVLLYICCTYMSGPNLLSGSIVTLTSFFVFSLYFFVIVGSNS